MDDSQSENQQFSHQPLEYGFSHLATKFILETGSSNKCGTWYLFSLAEETSFVRRRGGHFLTFHVASLACCLTEERSCSWKMRPSSSSWESRGGEVMALSCPCWPSLAPAYLGWAGAMGAKTCHLGSNSGITGSCARSNFTHFGFDRFLAPLQVVYSW